MTGNAAGYIFPEGKYQHCTYDIVTNLVLPEKIWVCGFCRAQFIEAWRLKRHLVLSHEVSETRAWALTDRSEYWLRVRRAIYLGEERTDQEDVPVKRDNRRRPGKR